jgi:5-methylcytosine-specific restriction endonuclease McrA
MAEDIKRREARMKAYAAQPQQKKNRALRNKARRQAIAHGKVRKGDGKDIDHIQPLSKGGGTGASNLRVLVRSENRGHGMAVRPKGVSRFLKAATYGKFRG